MRTKRGAPRRRPRGDETREKLFAAAIALFAEHGYQATSVERIATEAGVAKGTFFVHFDSKDEVLVEVVRAHARAATAARTRVRQNGGSAIDGMREAMTTLARQASGSRAIARGVLAAALESEAFLAEASTVVERVFLADAREAQRGGLVARADPAALVSSLVAEYLGTLLQLVIALPAQRRGPTRRPAA
ncbi:MAG: transcriptional regulator, TetR family [Myxococcales bacterium]|nr:transcriptional regulator, TetR family [Myxococcales bacterium]